MKTRTLPLLVVTASLLVVGCTSKRLPSKYDLPLAGIAHIEPIGLKQQFVVCSICPHPTPKTLAVPEEVVEAVVEMPVYTPAPVAAPAVQLIAVARTSLIVPFKYNSSLLGPRGKREVKNALVVLKSLDLDEYNVTIHGYTDDLGTQPFNQKLAWKRGHAVLNELRKEQVRTPIMVTANGECCFVTDNSSEVKRSPNRRAEVVLILKRKGEGDGKE